MSLRPRSAEAGRTHDRLYAHAASVIASRQDRRVAPTDRGLGGYSSLTFRPLQTASIDGFCSVPDVNEFEALDRRVIALEAQLNGTTSGYTATQKTLQSLLAQSTDFANRVQALELSVTRLLEDNKALTAKLESYTRSDLRFGTLIDQLSRTVSDLDTRMRRHERNAEMHTHDHERNEPKGFQPNDQPRHFMGRK